MTKKLFNEIEEKKSHLEKMEVSNRVRVAEERQKKENEENIKKEHEKLWENTREKRVKHWRKFSEKRDKNRKRGKYEIKAPLFRTEERNDQLPKLDLKMMKANINKK